MLSTRTRPGHGVRRATSSPATGSVRKARNAAYRWMAPDADSGSPGGSVGNAPTSRMHPAQTATRAATRGFASARASTSASAPPPTAIVTSETDSSQPDGRKWYSLIRSRTGLSRGVTCSATSPAVPTTIAARPTGASARTAGVAGGLIDHSMTPHCPGRATDGVSEIDRMAP